MQMCQGHCYLSSEELSLVLGETLDSDQVSEQLTTLDKLHEKVNSKLILEDILHVNKEGMLDGIQNIFLQLNVLHLLILQNHIFPDALHGIELLVKLVLHQEYFTESTLADQFSEFEVLQL